MTDSSASAKDTAALVDILRGFSAAYPTDVFTPLTDRERSVYARVITRTAGEVGRHFGKYATEAADMIEALRRACEEARDALDAMFAPAHVDGCLWKADHRMPCQCGSFDREHNAIAAGRAALARLRSVTRGQP